MAAAYGTDTKLRRGRQDRRPHRAGDEHILAVAHDRYLPPVDPPPAVASAGSAYLSTRQKASAACADIGLEQGSLAYGRCVAEGTKLGAPVQVQVNRGPARARRVS